MGKANCRGNPCDYVQNKNNKTYHFIRCGGCKRIRSLINAIDINTGIINSLRQRLFFSLADIDGIYFKLKTYFNNMFTLRQNTY